MGPRRTAFAILSCLLVWGSALAASQARETITPPRTLRQAFTEHPRGCWHCLHGAGDSTRLYAVDPMGQRKPKPLVDSRSVGKRAAPGSPITVYLDFTSFAARLTELAGGAGVDDFSLAERTQLQDDVESQLEEAYAAYTVTFTQDLPVGDFETLDFGTPRTTILPTGAGTLGIAMGFPDFRNQSGTDLGYVFPEEFVFILDEFTGGTNRALQLSQLTRGLSSTAAHELGHNLGLQHYDPYGDPRIVDPDDTGEIQNVHIMATSNTGLGEAAREAVRTFGSLSRAKLAYSSGLTASTPASLSETAGAHGTAGTAQDLGLDGDDPPSALTGTRSVNVLGEIASNGELDYYRFTARAGQLILINTISDQISQSLDSYDDPIDCFVRLLDTDGTTEIASNDDIRYGWSTIETGETGYGTDSLLANRIIPADGTYYIVVKDFSTDTGFYELFVTLTDPPPVRYDPAQDLVSVGDEAGDDDTVVITQTGIALKIDFNGTLWTFFTNFTFVDNIEVELGAGNDLLRIDWNGGSNPIPLMGAIDYAGGPNGGAGDTLEVLGDGVVAPTYAPHASTTGSGTLSFTQREIVFSGVDQPLLVTGMQSLTFDPPNGSTTMTLANPQAGWGRLSGSDGGVNFATLTFTEVGALTLDLTAGNGLSEDTVTLGPDLSLGFGGTVPLATVDLTTGPGDDTVTAGLSTTTEIDLDGGNPAPPASPGDRLIFNALGLDVTATGGEPDPGTFDAAGYAQLGYQNFEAQDTTGRLPLGLSKLRYQLFYSKRAKGLGENVDTLLAQGILNFADLEAAGVNVTSFAGASLTFSLQGAEFDFGTPASNNGKTVIWDFLNAPASARFTLTLATGKFTLTGKALDLDNALAPLGADNLIPHPNDAVEVVVGLEIGAWQTTAAVTTLYKLAKVDSTGTGQFSYGKSGSDLPEGLFVVSKAQLQQRLHKTLGLQQRLLLDVLHRPPNGTSFNPSANGVELILGTFVETVGDGSVGGSVFVNSGTAFTYKRPTKTPGGAAIPLDGVSSAQYNLTKWTARLMTHWLADGDLGIDPVTNPATDPFSVDLFVRQTTGGHTAQTTVRLVRTGTSTLYRR
ncbi:MAG: hypothetical protein AMXMBFR7_42460 [Planctomycetota bacterium]